MMREGDLPGDFPCTLCEEPEESAMRVRASLALMLAATGCTTTYTIPKSELSRLHGWEIPEVRWRRSTREPRRLQEVPDPRLRDIEGREHTFTEDTPLVLVERDGDVIAEKYLEVTITEGDFRGVPQAAFRQRVEVPLQEVESAAIREFSPAKTLVLGTGVIVGLVGFLAAARMALGNPAPPEEKPCTEGCTF